MFPRKWVGKLIEYKAIRNQINENGKREFVALPEGKLVNQVTLKFWQDTMQKSVDYIIITP